MTKKTYWADAPTPALFNSLLASGLITHASDLPTFPSEAPKPLLSKRKEKVQKSQNFRQTSVNMKNRRSLTPTKLFQTTTGNVSATSMVSLVSSTPMADFTNSTARNSVRPSDFFGNPWESITTKEGENPFHSKTLPSDKINQIMDEYQTAIESTTSKDKLITINFDFFNRVILILKNGNRHAAYLLHKIKKYFMSLLLDVSSIENQFKSEYELELETAHNESLNISKEIQNLKIKLMSYETQIEQLKTNLTQKEEKIEELQDTVNDLNQEIKHFQEAFESSNDEIRVLNQTNKRLTQIIETKKSFYQKKKKKNRWT